LVGKASALSNTIRQIAGSLSITIMSTIMQGKTDYNYSKLSEQINVYNKTSNNTINVLTKLYMHSGQPQKTAQGSALSQLAKMIQGQATVDAMAYSIAVSSLIVFVAIILAVSMRTRKVSPKKNKEGE